MKAFMIEQYGSPDVMQLVDTEQPQPGPGEVLVKIHAAGTNPADWHFIRGEPFFARFEFGFPRPKIHRTGNDLAGVVAATGPDVTAFKPGDTVFGQIEDFRMGAFAEYACMSVEGISHKPENISFEEAAGVPIAAVTALQGLRDSGQLQAGQSVLVNGASGGVGTFAVQIAKALGASEVTGVSSARNHELVRSIGADHMIDYKTEDFTRTGKQYDLVFDAVGNRSAAAYARAVKPGGRAIVAGFTTMGHMLLQVVLLGSLRSRLSDKHIGMMGTAKTNQADLQMLAELLADGTIKTVIDRTYPFAQTPDAMHYLETGHARGKVIITTV